MLSITSVLKIVPPVSSFYVNELSALCGGRWLLGGRTDGPVTQLLTDSRALVKPAGTLFFAIAGKLDGHQYISDLYQRGVRHFVVEKDIPLEQIPDADVLRVEESVLALQRLATAHRLRFHTPVVGITGSNGKTIVKEFLYQLLKEDEHIVRSPKSYNSQIGVPLSVWHMQAAHSLAIFEAGISRPGEMQRLEKVIHPDTGIFTYIGDAHAEGFTDEHQKIVEKLELFSHSRLLIIPEDQPQIRQAILQRQAMGWNPSLAIYSWGFAESADLRLLSAEKTENETWIEGVFSGRAFQWVIPFTDRASVHNALTAGLWMLLHRYSPADVARRLISLQPVEMRLELRDALQQCVLINDAYNADIQSLRIALDFLAQQKKKNKVVVLSDILQSGEDPQLLYARVAEWLRDYDISQLIAIGPALMSVQSLFGAVSASFYPDTETALNAFSWDSFQDAVILLKGARPFRFEQIARRLERQVHDTVLEIHLGKMAANLRAYRSVLKPETRIMAMVKAFAYGSGSVEIARLLQRQRVDYLAVAYADEGALLRREGVDLPIMVMNTEARSLESCLDNRLEPVLFSLRSVEQFCAVLRRRSAEDTVYVHLELDTGMHRLGLALQDIPTALSHLQAFSSVRIASVFSHLVAAEDQAADDFTTQQIERMQQGCKLIQQMISYPFLQHIANSHGASRHPGAEMDMVRLGIGLYGMDESDALRGKLELVSSLRARIAQIHLVEPGDTVGYNRRGVVSKKTRIGTISLGYADGFMRQLGHGRAVVYAGGNSFPTIGSVCMDLTMIDLGMEAPVQEGDEVIVFAHADHLRALTKAAETIPYAFLAGISQRVKRTYIQE